MANANNSPAVKEKGEWYRLTVDETFKKLEINRSGLSSSEVKSRLEKYGYNELVFKKPSVLMRFLRQFHNPLVYILLAAATITTVLSIGGEDMWADTGVILGVVILNAILGFFQEGKTELQLVMDASHLDDIGDW